MIEIMANIDAYLASKGAPHADGQEDFFNGDSQTEIMARHDPSPLIRKRYLTGGYWAEFNFSYFKKSSDPITARQALESIMAALELDNFTSLLGLSQGRLEVIARPTPVSRDEDGTVIYTSSFRLVYFQEVTT
jgi:hypothetical protein